MKFNLLRIVKKFIVISVVVMFLSTNCAQSVSFAQMTTLMPQVGTMIGITAPYVPPQLVGFEFDEYNPFSMSFLVNRGEKQLSLDKNNEEYMRFVKYFLAALTVPDSDQWVNLSPYEGKRVIEKSFGKTEMGKDLLAQDYILKQLASSLVYPEEEIGEKFWMKVRKLIYKRYGENVDLPLDMFNRVWIVPGSADIYEDDGRVWVVDSQLKVMLEKDYVALESFQNFGGLEIIDKKEDMSPVVSEVMREVVIPELEREVNEGAHFTVLRQIYSAMILATWYKKSLKDSIVGKMYANQSNVEGIYLEGSEEEVKRIYDQYVESFRMGVFNYIKDEYDPVKQEIIPRKYFSGGFGRKEKDVVNNLGEKLKEESDQASITKILNVIAEFKERNEESLISIEIGLKVDNSNLSKSTEDSLNLIKLRRTVKLFSVIKLILITSVFLGHIYNPTPSMAKVNSYVGHGQLIKTIGPVKSNGHENTIKTIGPVESNGHKNKIKTTGRVESDGDKNTIKTTGRVESDGDNNKIKTTGRVESDGDNNEIKTTGRVESDGDNNEIKTTGRVESDGDNNEIKTTGPVNSDGDNNLINTSIPTNSTTIGGGIIGDRNKNNTIIGGEIIGDRNKNNTIIGGGIIGDRNKNNTIIGSYRKYGNRNNRPVVTGSGDNNTIYIKENVFPPNKRNKRIKQYINVISEKATGNVSVIHSFKSLKPRTHHIVFKGTNNLTVITEENEDYITFKVVMGMVTVIVDKNVYFQVNDKEINIEEYSKEGITINKLKNGLFEIIIARTELFKRTADNASLKKKVGGINFDASMLDMRIRRGKNNKPLAWELQDHTLFDFTGLTPVIIDISFVEDDIFPDIAVLKEKFFNQEKITLQIQSI